MSRRTPFLFEVPKDRPSKYDRIQAFKRCAGIWTCYAPHLDKEECRWTAVLLCKIPESKIMDYIAKWCVCMEDEGQMVHGTSELDAIRKVCAARKIRCPL